MRDRHQHGGQPGEGRGTARGRQGPDMDLQGWVILAMVISCGHPGGLAGLRWPFRAGPSTSCRALVFFDVFILFCPPSGRVLAVRTEAALGALFETPICMAGGERLPRQCKPCVPRSPRDCWNRCLLEAGVQINQIVSEALGILESRLSTKSCADVAQFDAGFSL